jgi:hypothetical protein
VPRAATASASPPRLRVCIRSDPLRQVQRRAALAEIAELRAELAGFEAELAQHGACDPVKVAEQRRALDLGKEASLRWTGACSHFIACFLIAFLACAELARVAVRSFFADNYLILLSYYTREKGIAAADVSGSAEPPGYAD